MRAPAISTPLLAGAAIAFALSATGLHLVGRIDARRDRTAAVVLDAAYATQGLASKIAACSDGSRALPPTSRDVPAELPRGHAVATSVSDWGDVAFRCADFRLDAPAFQIQWRLSASPSSGFETEGLVRARADVDGDGLADHVVETSVACTRDMCEVAPTVHLERVP